MDDLVGEIEEFVTESRHAPESNRVLATVVFTDIDTMRQSADSSADSAGSR